MFVRVGRTFNPLWLDALVLNLTSETVVNFEPGGNSPPPPPTDQRSQYYFVNSPNSTTITAGVRGKHVNDMGYLRVQRADVPHTYSFIPAVCRPERPYLSLTSSPRIVPCQSFCLTIPGRSIKFARLPPGRVGCKSFQKLKGRLFLGKKKKKVKMYISRLV